jgi:tetratricopeptide (TPR) repeat protein
MNGRLFLSHAHRDKPEAEALRRALEDSGVGVWEDALELRAGDRLADLEKEVKASRGFLLLWTSSANESEWVERETGWAREARQENPDYRILVVLRGGGQVSARRLVGEELLFIAAAGASEEAVPEIRRALGERAPSGRVASAPAPAPLLEELVISFGDARIEESGGRRRAAGRFRLEHRPASGAGSRSPWHQYESPLGPLEIEEIRWYLERYPGWPFGTFRERAAALEMKLPEWGRALYDLTLGQGEGQTLDWRRATGSARRVVVEVDDGAGESSASAGAAALLALPWELLADVEGYLFEGGLRARVVRRIPRGSSKASLPLADRLRVLLVIARPEGEGVGFLDPRASARPLVEALAPLGRRAGLEVLADGTLPALRDALARAETAGRPFHVVHFDGHGIYDPTAGLGKLCFEDPADARENKLERRPHLVDAEELGALLRERRVPLFVLEACQTAMAGEEVKASVAARLLAAGAGSVLAMTHAVLVETARRFVGTFYQRLVAGERIGAAMVDAEHQLRDDPRRGEVGGHGELLLQDWFVPVLFQEEAGDLQLLQAGAAADPQDLAAERSVREGELPESPAHGFVGRARELLTVQRLLRDHRCLTLLGGGGQGKTALAVESARWLLDLRRFERIAFASVEDLPDARLMVERLGRQLVPDYSVAREEGAGSAGERLARARLPVERVLAERRVLLVVDNLESLLAAPGREAPAGADEVFGLLGEVSKKGETRLLLTSREAPPGPLEGASVPLGPLSQSEGRELLAGVLARAGQAPAGDADEKRADELIEAVSGHARSLVLLAPLVAERGLEVTAKSVAGMMAKLEALHPGRRELSLLASVRLSLDRLPEPARKQVRALAVFHGSARVEALARVLEVENEEALTLGRQLVALGLAGADGPYLFPDPALGPAVADELSGEERRELEQRWLQATLGLITHLYNMMFENAASASQGTQASLADLLAAIAKAEEEVEAGRVPAAEVMHSVTALQALVRRLGREAARARLEETRRRLKARLGEWSHAAFNSAKEEIDQRLETGDVSNLVRAAEELEARAVAAGDVYPEAAYDRALAHLMLSRALRSAGRAGESLSPLAEAERKFTELAQAGDKDAARMLGPLSNQRGDALLELGRLEEAVRCYERAIELAAATGNQRSAAVARAQIGTVRLEQGRLQDALLAYGQARETFAALDEPGSVAAAWHQIGSVYEEARQWDQAEAAYQHSLSIEVERGNKRGQALTVGQIGTLYARSGRLEEAARLQRQAATLDEEVGDDFSRAGSLKNLAATLAALGRIDEARDAARECSRIEASFGHAAQPWKTWALLEQIETDADSPEAARTARSRAMELYAAYRRDGGAPLSDLGRLLATIGAALKTQGEAAASNLIPPPDRFAPALLPVRDALLAILAGSRDPALANDPRLDYEDAVELSLLLESLANPTLPPPPPLTPAP